MKNRPKLVLEMMVLLAGGIVPVAHATTYTGEVTGLQSQPSPTTPGNIRVSIQVTLTTGCSGFGGKWYSYDLPSGSAASMYGAILLAALHTGREVIITGSGTCDSYNVEMVSAIEAQ